MLDMESRATAPRPRRADAQQNYDRLLSAAATVFAEEGTDAAVENVARQAGVGVGTLYRHFPTRSNLIEALLAQRYDELTVRAYDLLAADDAGDALLTWLRSFVVHVTTFRGLAASARHSMQAQPTAGSPTSFSCQAMRAAAAALLARAQRQGAVRSDIDISEVLQLTNAVAWVTERDRDASDRFLSLVTNGLGAQSVPGPNHVVKASRRPAPADPSPSTNAT